MSKIPQSYKSKDNRNAGISSISSLRARIMKGGSSSDVGPSMVGMAN